MKTSHHQKLKQELGVPAAVLMGLGSILGTGIFVSIGLAAGIAGPAVILAIALAAAVATCNALSSAQLAAAHPVSGGTYEYGYQYLHPAAGFLAGWLFLLAKSASAATAALGFAGYTLALLEIDSVERVPLAFVTVLLFTGVVLAGLRRSHQLNIIIVTSTIVALLSFVVCGLVYQVSNETLNTWTPFLNDEGESSGLWNFFNATALMFVAYTGYGRIATMAEEVRDPTRTIPRAIVATLVISALLYIAVAAAAVGSVGTAALLRATMEDAAPLEVALSLMGYPAVAWLVAIGAATAMLGVLLNLILGLSRVYLAMGRRGDLPSALSLLDARQQTPWVAVIVTGLLIAALTLIGSVKTTWSFSAFTVLSYYAITNAAALALPREQRRYPQWIAVAGLASCVALAFWVESSAWIGGLAMMGVGMLWFLVKRKWSGKD